MEALAVCLSNPKKSVVGLRILALSRELFDIVVPALRTHFDIDSKQRYAAVLFKLASRSEHVLRFTRSSGTLRC